jgi:nucleoside phosphorylase
VDQFDVLIVTALKVEREAVLAQLTNAVKIQKEDSPTYYTSSVAVGETQTYSIVVVSLLEMGNTEAAVRTASAIAEFKPRCVLMVGIAGGIESQVKLGDVIVANQIFYYELAKQKSDGDQDRRTRVIPVNRHLLDRAHHYDNLTWVDKIGVERPDGAIRTPHPVHFGPIAVGEKVVTDPELIKKLQQLHSKMLGVEMESYGVAAAVGDSREQPAFLSIRSVCDYADSTKNDGWHGYAAATAAAFAIGFLRSGPLQQIRRVETNIGTTVLIIHQSMESVSTESMKLKATESFPGRALREFLIDQSDLYRDGVLTRPAEAVHRQSAALEGIKSILQQDAHAEIAFGGIAHVPLLFLAGFQLATKRAVRLLEHRRDRDTWDQLDGQETGQVFDLESQVPRSRALGDVVLRVSLSFDVVEELTKTVCSDPLASLHLKVPVPKRDIVTHNKIVENYTQMFRDTLDSVASLLPNARRVHLFYAGPASLAFNFGRQISRTTHPEVAVYNYMSRPEPRYSWGVVINKPENDSDFLVTL